MDHLGSDISFGSTDMDSLDFPSGEPIVIRPSLPLQILPSDGSYTTATGLDLQDYGMSLSPNIGINNLGDSVLGLGKSGDPSPGSLHGSYDNSMPITVRSMQESRCTSSPSVTSSNTGITDTAFDHTSIDVQSLLLANLQQSVLSKSTGGRSSVSTTAISRSPIVHSLVPTTSPYVHAQSIHKHQKYLWPAASCSSNATASSLVGRTVSSDSGTVSDTASTLVLSNMPELNSEVPNLPLLASLPSSLEGIGTGVIPKGLTTTTGDNPVTVTMNTDTHSAVVTSALLNSNSNQPESNTLTTSADGTESQKCLSTPRPVKLEISKVSDNTTVLKLSFVHEQSTLEKSMTEAERQQDFVLNPQLLSSLFSDKTLQDMTRLLSPEFTNQQLLSPGNIADPEKGVIAPEDSSQKEDDSLDCMEKPENDTSLCSDMATEAVDINTEHAAARSSDFETSGSQQNEQTPSEDEDETPLNRLKQENMTLGTEDDNHVTDDACEGQQDEKPEDYNVGDHLGNLISSIDKSGDIPTAVQFSQILAAQGRGAGVDKSELNVHIDDSQCVVRDGQRRWACNRCDKSYTTKHNLVTHTLAHSGIKPHCCVICGKMFKQVSHLNTHMLTHTTIRPHVCKICNRSFTQTSHVKRHMAVHMERRPYVCDICGRGFAYPCELKSHVEKHKRSKDNMCDTCGAAFDNPIRLKAHVQVSHRDEADLTCKECGKRYTYPSQLRDHMIKHSGKRPYMCGECGMEFMKEHHLKAHQFTHTGLKPWVCQMCFRSFNQKANMQRHMLVHENDKKFECEVCNRSFSQPQTLKAHQVTHAEKKPYQCTVCGKQFGRLHNLQGHMHMHQDSRPHVCFCGAAFTLKGNLNRHKKVKHGLTDPSECTDEEAAKILNSMSSKRSLDSVEAFPDTEHNYPKNKRKSVPRKNIAKVEDDEEGMDEIEDESAEDIDGSQYGVNPGAPLEVRVSAAGDGGEVPRFPEALAEKDTSETITRGETNSLGTMEETNAGHSQSLLASEDQQKVEFVHQHTIHGGREIPQANP